MNDTRRGNTNSAIKIEPHALNPEVFLENIASRFRSFGAEHILITGLPLPGRDLNKLILLQHWGDGVPNTIPSFQVKGNDVLLRKIATLCKPVQWQLSEPDNGWLNESGLIEVLKRTSKDPMSFQTIMGIQLHHFNSFQIAICLAGSSLTVGDREIATLTANIQHELVDVHEANPIIPSRPGELSTRERMVLNMTAQGKTASSIAAELQISQRTVHAHLQNASEKMQAANKTQTVVEAMRYGQIRLC